VQLPFSHDQFLDLFGQYNRALWPFLLVLWLLTAGAVWRLFRNRRAGSRIIAGILAFHWAWSGAVYHLTYFRRINPAALLFGTAFLVQAILLLWQGVFKSKTSFDPRRPKWHSVAWGLILYSLLYPVLGLLLGLQVPRWPSFGVPCPTTILTVGVLLLLPRRTARLLGIIPVLWAAVGGSAAFVLGIHTDYVLGLAGILLVVYMVTPGERGHDAT
jgi:hypothetical protein